MDCINIPGYGPLPFIDKNPQNFFRRTTILYGPSETGKTVIVRWIMAVLQPYIPNVIIICPTESGNEDYKGIVPERCIFTNIDIKTLRDIYDRQVEATEIYNKANRIEVMQPLFKKCNDLTSMEKVARMERISAQSLENLKHDSTKDMAQRNELTKTIKKTMNKVLKQMYKKTIKEYVGRIPHLTECEKYVIKYLDFNPSLLLIMDDCQAQIADWGQDSTVNKLFFQGRHMWATSIYTMQSDTGRPGLAPGIRNNTFNNVFTDANIAMRFFNNKDNGFTPDIKKHAQKIIYELFKDNSNGVENFKRFVYSRLDKTAKLRYIIADEVEGLKFGSPALWRLCNGIPTEDKKLTANKFTKSFTV